MTATLTFDLTDPDDSFRHKLAIHGNDMHAAIFSAIQKMGRYYKDCQDSDLLDTIEDMRRILLDELEANNINHLFD